MIPEQAIEAAAKEIWKIYVGHDLSWFKKFGSAYDRHRAEETAKAALEAALPHLEHAIREQIAAEIRNSAMTLIPGSKAEVARSVQRQDAGVIQKGTPQ